MITDSDIKKMKKVFVTKQEFNKGTIDIRKEIKSTENYLDYKIETARKESQEFIREFHKFKDSTLKTLDWLVGAFRKFEEEFTVMAHHNREVLDRLENDETRITNLEKNPAFQ